MKDHKLKITGGKLRSRLLSFDKNNLIRPTKSYVRELLFNVIEISNTTKCLDLFAGSGILSAEALSRGANHIDLVENSSTTCNMIRTEFEKLNVGQYYIYNSKVFDFLNNQQYRNYNVIFIDPPYKGDMLLSTLSQLMSLDYLTNTKYIYFEHNKDDLNTKYINLIDNEFSILKDLSIGDVSYTIAKKR